MTSASSAETQLIELLSQTLDDGRLSRTERQTVTAFLDAARLQDAGLARLRAAVFEMARKAMEVARPQRALDWLEDVIRLLVPGNDQVTHQAECLFSPDDDCPSRIVSLFENAKETVDVCVFTITDDRISESILRADRRGVRVRIVTDDDKMLDAGSDVARLKVAGIPVRVDNSPAHMHNKFAIFDEETLLTGSYNWTRGAANHNDENLMLTAEPRFVGKFRTLFMRLWKMYE